MAKKKPTILLKKELTVGEVNNLLSEYVIDRYGNKKVSEEASGKFVVQFEYKFESVRGSDDTLVIVQVCSPP